MRLLGKFFHYRPKNNQLPKTVWLTLLLLFHLILLFLVRFTAWPEMFTYPWLLSRGFRLYGDIIQPYLPLLPLLLFIWYGALGHTILALRILTLITILASDILVFRIGAKLYGIKRGLLSLLIFIMLQIVADGNGLWFDLVSLPLVLVTLCLLIPKPQNSRRIFWAGISLGLAILVKQTSVLFILPVTVMLFRYPKQLWHFILATVVPVVVTALFYLTGDQAPDFWYWGIIHPLFFHGRMPGFMLLPTTRDTLKMLILFAPALWFIRKRSVLGLWFLISLLFGFPRFSWFHLQHAAAFIGLGVPLLWERRKKSPLLLIFYLLLAVVILGKYAVREANRPVRFFEPDIIRQRAELVSRLPVTENVFFLNVSSENFVGNIVPMKPWADTFPWYLEVSGMQTLIRERLETAQIKYVVYKPFITGGRYDLGAYKPDIIYTYFQSHFVFSKFLTDSLQLWVKKD